MRACKLIAKIFFYKKYLIDMLESKVRRPVSA
jgi:hypothetical protein